MSSPDSGRPHSPAPTVWSSRSGHSSAYPSTPATSTAPSTTGYHGEARPQKPFIDTSFFSGSPTSSNAQQLYIHVNPSSSLPEGNDAAGSGAGGRQSEFWVTVPWTKVAPKLLEHRDLIFDLLGDMSGDPEMKARALEMLNAGNGQKGHDGQQDFSLYPGHATSPTGNGTMPLFNAPPTMEWTLPDDAQHHPMIGQVPATPMTSFGGDSGQSSAGSPGSMGCSPWTFPPSQFDSLSLAPTSSVYPHPGYGSQYGPPATPSMSPMPTVTTANMFGNFPSEITAPQGCIDESILHQVETNIHQEEFIWSPQDATLYEVGNARAIQAQNMQGSIRMIFPPHTYILGFEKDGAVASPAFRPLHPHSNQWLKAQVCDRRCAYRAGTNSLKRPITIRDHFRKCVYLEDHHPLKVLCTLELAAHERQSQGLLPNRRRSRGARVNSMVKTEPSTPVSSALSRSTRSYGPRSSLYSEDSADESASSYQPSPSKNVRPRAIKAGPSSDDSSSDFSPSKAPRSLRGITAIADGGNGHANTNNSSSVPSIAQNSAPSSPRIQPGFMMQPRRHTVADIRSPYSNGFHAGGSLFGDMPGSPSHSTLFGQMSSELDNGLFSSLNARFGNSDVDTSPFESSISSMESPDFRPSNEF